MPSSLSWQHMSAGPARPHNHGSRRPIFDRRSSTSRVSTSASSTSSFSDDEDAITPCPPQSLPQQDDEQQISPRQQQPRTNLPHRPNAERPQSWRSSQVMSAPDDTEPQQTQAEVDSVTLWRRMLVIQRMFGCYNSARMRAALDSGVEDRFVPSRTCLDLLNDSIDQLPEESRRQVEEFLEHGDTGERKSWRQRLEEMRGWN